MALEVINIVINAADRASAVLSKINKNADKLKSSLKKVGDAGKKMATRITLPIAAVGAGMIALAADAEETQSKFNVVFKGMAEETNKWAEDFATSVGRSKNEIKSFTAGMADVLKPMGQTTEEAAAMSKSMVELALDVASFNNKSDTDVIAAFTSALTGERESLKSLGIVMSEADVKQEALTLGLVKQGEELDKSVKTQATMSLLFKNTADAQGDLARTSESFTNQMKSLKAATGDLGTELGKALLPMATKLVGIFRDLVDRFANLSPRMQKMVLIALAIAAAIGPLIVVISALGTALLFLFSPIGLVVAAIVAFIAIITMLILKWDEFMLSVTAVLDAIDARVSVWLTSAKDGIIAAWNFIMKFVTDILNGIKEFFKEMILAWSIMLDDFVKAIAEIFTAGKELVVGAFRSVFEAVENVILNIIARIKAAIEAMVEFIKSAANAAKDPIGALLPGFKASIQSAGTKFKEKFLAKGGPMKAGESAVVGDGGEPELFTAGASGFVTPFSKMGGGGGGITLNINGPISSKEVAEDMMDIVIDKLKLHTKTV